MKTILTQSIIILTCALCHSVEAQVVAPYSFSAGTVASPDEVNANFAKFSDALNRTGGTMTGTLTSRAIAPSADATYPLGDTTHRYTTGWFSSTVTMGPLAATTGAFSSTLGVTGATTLSSTLGVTGATTLSSTLGVTGAATLSSTLSVSSTVAWGGGSAITTSSNVALLSASNTFGGGVSGGTVQTVRETDAAESPLMVFKRKSGAASSTLGGLRWQDSSGNNIIALESNASVGAGVWEWNTYSGATPTVRMQLSSAGALTVTGTVTAPSVNGSSSLNLQTGGSTRWTVNSAGDLLNASGHITLSSGTPTISSGAGAGATIAGTDSAFVVQVGTGASTAIAVNFAHVFSGTLGPSCHASTNLGSTFLKITSSSTQVSVTTSANFTNTDAVWVTCIGY